MSISKLVWSPDGTRVASLETFLLTEDGKEKESIAIHVWEALTGKTIALIECPIWVWEASPGEFPTIDWLPNNKQLAYLRGSTVQVIDAANGKPVLSHLFSHTLDYMRLSSSPSGKSLALISKDWKVVFIWNIANNTPMSFTIPQTLAKIAWSPDEKHIISCSREPHGVYIWNIASRQNIYTYSGHSDFVRMGIWSPDGGQILSASDKEIILWQAF